MTDKDSFILLQQELQMAEQHIAQVEAKVAALKKVLYRVPHASGDHTDLCRMENAGLPPKDINHCHCHVALVRQSLSKD